MAADTDGDSVFDHLEDADGDCVKDAGETDWMNPDTDYDGRSDGEELAEGTNPLDPNSAAFRKLAMFQFNDENWLGNRGQEPLNHENISAVDAWITKGLMVSNSSPALLRYRDVEPADGKANIHLRRGTIRFWFKPLWNSGSGEGPGSGARLIEVGTNAEPAEATGLNRSVPRVTS